MRKVITIILVIFICSCGNLGYKASLENDDLLAFRFQGIKGNLQEFSNKHNAKLSTVWSKVQKYNPDALDSFLVSHLVWTDGRFGKAIFIQQHSDINGIDTTTWDFKNIVWLQDTILTAKPTYEINLLTKVVFQIIERDIDLLLRTSEKNLNAVRREDLK
jgi:hypothetical protein